MLTQFQTAFNDNALKFLVIYLIVDATVAGTTQNFLILLVGALFALPFVLFSMTGGFLADRWSKRSVTIGTKWMEVAAITFSLVGLARASLPMELGGVFLLSSEGALFGPSKYGLLPELLPEKDLSWGNGITELLTFLAAIGATIASGFLAYYFRGRQAWSGAILLVCTFAGLLASYGITRIPVADPGRAFNANPLGDLFGQIRKMRADRLLGWAVVGNTYLWFLAALLQFTIVVYGHDILRIDERHISYLQAAVGIGIGLGSLATGYLSAGKIEYGLIPLGALGLTVFGFLSAGHGLSLDRAALYLGLLGFSGGFYAVPLNALIQHRPEPADKGGMIAAANLLSFVGVFLAAGAYFLLAEILHLAANQVLFAGACMTLAAGIYAVAFFPNSVLRLGLWLLAGTSYRIHVVGRDNIPERGAAVLIASRLSSSDLIALAAATDRRIHFYVDTRTSCAAQSPHLSSYASLLLRALRVTTLSTDEACSRAKWREQVFAVLSSREVVCLAADNVADWWNSLGREESLQTLWASAKPAVVPIRVDSGQGVHGTGSAASSHRPSGILQHITATFGSPMPPSATAAELVAAVEAIASAAPATMAVAKK